MAAGPAEADRSPARTSGTPLRIRTERRGHVCVIALSGPLDGIASAALGQCVRSLRATRPGRLVIDLSRVSSVDFAGSRALLAATRPAPGQAPVIVRAVPAAARQRLEFLGHDLGRPDWDGRPAEGRPPGWQRSLEGSATAILVSKWRHLQGSAERAAAETHRARQRLAETEDRVASTLDRMAARRLAESARLAALGRSARGYADALRSQDQDAPWDIPGPDLGTITTLSRPYSPSSTVGRAVAFIEEHAHDDISIADIAGAAFVTVRAAQLAFRRYLGTTPMGYLRQIRLERAHEHLLSADPASTTVTAVAADWHFTNASRFSAYYRAAYGVTPTQTLRQRPAGDQGSGGHEGRGAASSRLALVI